MAIKVEEKSPILIVHLGPGTPDNNETGLSVQARDGTSLGWGSKTRSK